MALTFYCDTHIAKAVATQLRAKGISVIRCEDVGMAEATDEEHLDYATAREYILVSQDDDFLLLDAQWKAAGKSHAGIMCAPPHLQGAAQISFLVTQLSFYVEADEADAIDYTTEIYNQVIFL